jgi:branched-subunit amino acid transport protein
MKSNFLKLNWNDAIKGIVVAIVTALLTGLYQVIQSNGVFDWVTLKPVLIASFGAGISYIVKNLLTNSNNELLKKE